MGAVQQLAFKAELGRAKLYNDKLVNYDNYSQFKSVEEFNSHWEQLMAEYKKFFNRTQLEILTVYRQHAVVHPGVAYKSYRRIIEAFTARYGYTPHENTFRNTIDKAEKYGLLIKNYGMRLIKGHGSTTANIIVFNRVEDVKAFQIAQMKRKEEETLRLLEENYAEANKVTKFAQNARIWAEQKAENERKKAEYAAAKERRQKEIDEAAAEEEKRNNLYNKMREVVQAKKMDMNKMSEYAGIVFASINKAVAMDNKISQKQAEEIAFKCFLMMCNKADKDIKKTRAALLSYLLKRDLVNVATGYTPSQIAQKQAVTSGKKVRVEQTPDWFEKRNERVSEAPNNTIDFEAEAAKVRAKFAEWREQ